MRNLSILFVSTTSIFGANTILVFPWMDMTHKNHISARSYEIDTQ